MAVRVSLQGRQNAHGRVRFEAWALVPLEGAAPELRQDMHGCVCFGAGAGAEGHSRDAAI